MGKPKPPKPADPKETGAAQTATNIGSAIAQQNLNNVNQVTPYGNLTYDQTGSYEYVDPLDGKTHTIPTYTATQTLSPEQQVIADQNNRANLNLSRLGADQSERLNNLLGRPMDTNSLPASGNANSIRRTKLRRVGYGPGLQTELGNVGAVQRQIADSGSIDRTLGNAGAITRSYGTDFSDDRQRVEDALMSRINPRLEHDRKRLESRLSSQGIRVGSEAYNSAMDDYGRQTNDARFGAILNAGQEQSRMAGLEAQRAGFENSAQEQAFGQLAQRGNFTNQAQQQQFGQNAANAQLANNAQAQAFQQQAARGGFRNDGLQQMYQNRTQGIGMDNQAAVQEANADIARFDASNNARNQALQEQFALRNQPINEITGLLSGSQIQNPNFINPDTARLPTTDFAGIQANYDNAMQQRYNAQMAGWNSMVGGGLGFAANLIASDERVKTDVEKVGKTKDGQNIYKFRYKSGGPIQMGLMAQEVEKKKPGAVTNVGGIKMVDYSKALKGARS